MKSDNRVLRWAGTLVLALSISVLYSTAAAWTRAVKKRE